MPLLHKQIHLCQTVGNPKCCLLDVMSLALMNSQHKTSQHSGMEERETPEAPLLAEGLLAIDSCGEVGHTLLALSTLIWM